MAKRDVRKDQGLSGADVEYSEASQVLAFRREIKAVYSRDLRVSARLSKVKGSGAGAAH